VYRESEMNNSNQTLKFSRSSREAYGHQVSFEPEHHWAEPYLWAACLIGLGFMAGAVWA
jgi:cytochrome c-type biogenesis protein CcmH/NrfF